MDGTWVRLVHVTAYKVIYPPNNQHRTKSSISSLPTHDILLVVCGWLDPSDQERIPSLII